MTKCFLDDDIDQSLMMPLSLHDWLPEDHLARFVADLVPSLDLSEFYASYEQKDGRGQAAYHPVMMVRLLIYGYCIGVVSSRQIEKRTYEDVGFRYLSADEHPDHTRHLSIKLCLKDESCGSLESRLEHGIELRESCENGTAAR